MAKESLAVEFKSYEEISVGDSATLRRRITQEAVDAFAALTGDVNPLHVDENYASQTEFGQPVAHGMLAASFVSTMVGMQIPGPGALWTQQSFRWLLPVFVGDELTYTIRVKQKSPAIRVCVLEVNAVNQSGEKVLEGTGMAKALEA